MILKKVTEWWRKIQRKHAFKRVLIIESMTELPARLNSNLYIVRRGGHDRRAVFNCPCKCGRRIDLNLVKAGGPQWIFRLEKCKATIEPSVWLLEERCQSHFFIRENNVEWVQLEV
jgi:hypothetical protein